MNRILDSRALQTIHILLQGLITDSTFVWRIMITQQFRSGSIGGYREAIVAHQASRFAPSFWLDLTGQVFGDYWSEIPYLASGLRGSISYRFFLIAERKRNSVWSIFSTIHSGDLALITSEIGAQNLAGGTLPTPPQTGKSKNLDFGRLRGSPQPRWGSAGVIWPSRQVLMDLKVFPDTTNHFFGRLPCFSSLLTLFFAFSGYQRIES